MRCVVSMVTTTKIVACEQRCCCHGHVRLKRDDEGEGGTRKRERIVGARSDTPPPALDERSSTPPTSQRLSNDDDAERMMFNVRAHTHGRVDIFTSARRSVVIRAHAYARWDPSARLADSAKQKAHLKNLRSREVCELGRVELYRDGCFLLRNHSCPFKYLRFAALGGQRLS